MQKLSYLISGMIVGVGITCSLGATAQPSAPQPLRPVETRLDRWDIKPGKERELKEWMAYLKKTHAKSVQSMTGERNYFEAIFTSPDEPNHLYWVMVTGEGGATPSKPPADIDERHLTYMRDVLAKGSFRSLRLEEAILPDFVTTAIRGQQQREDYK